MSTPDQTPDGLAQNERVRARALLSSRIVTAVTITLCFGLTLYMLIELFPFVALVVSPVLVLLAFFMFRVFARFGDLEARLERIERQRSKADQ